MASLQVLLWLLAVPALVATGYLALLTLFSVRPRPPAAPPPRKRFDIVVPAHDEEAGIARTVESLRALEWPHELFRVLVVADNCSDATAERAAAAGATVLVRRDPERRGKGYALEFAFERVLADGRADAAVVVDADTVVGANLLAAFAGRLETGADAAQAEYAVLNPEASWRTRLMAIALALFHDVRSLGRERLGLSCGLRGNGMCFSAAALRRVPHRAFSLVEDLEYGIRLGEAGIRVHYASEARVLGEFVAGDHASRSQRRRWEGGRLAMLRLHGPSLLARGLRQRDRVLLDLAMDVLVPPLSWVAAWVGLGTAACAALSVARGALLPPLLAWGTSCAFLVAYVLRGVHASGMGLRGLAALAWAPAYMAWKVLVLSGRPAGRPGEWVRTARDGERPPEG